MLLLKQDIIRKGQVETIIKLDKSNSKEYKFEVICDNKVYIKESDSGYHLPDFCDLVLWKSYSEEENT